MRYDKKYAKEIKRYETKIKKTKEKARLKKKQDKINEKMYKEYDDKIMGAIADFILDIIAGCKKDPDGYYPIVNERYVKCPRGRHKKSSKYDDMYDDSGYYGDGDSD